MKPPVAVLHATGTNRDREAAWAVELAGGDPEIVHMAELVAGERRLTDYRMLVLPGGFSYGDDLGAGKVWAVLLQTRLGDDLKAFVAAGKPVIGICNGFQALVKAGFLPGDGGQTATLTRNDSARFECRWVTLEPNPDSRCIFTRELRDPILCPVAHGEGKLVFADEDLLARAERLNLTALRYRPSADEEAGYPGNPNGSEGHIAGLTNLSGTILGLMPHPEDHLVPTQHPRYHRGERGFTGLPLFSNGVRYAASL